MDMCIYKSTENKCFWRANIVFLTRKHDMKYDTKKRTNAPMKNKEKKYKTLLLFFTTFEKQDTPPPPPR